MPLHTWEIESKLLCIVALDHAQQLLHKDSSDVELYLVVVLGTYLVVVLGTSSCDLKKSTDQLLFSAPSFGTSQLDDPDAAW